jgi:histidine kinase/DNA gyrase B/HSP90-like ATPase
MPPQEPTDWEPDDWETFVPEPNDWETFVPANPKKGFWQGVVDVPEEVYQTANKAGKKAYGHIQTGEYPAAFRDIIDPVWSPIEGLIQMGVHKLENRPDPILNMSPEVAKKQGLEQALQLVGLPTEGFKQAWESSDYPRMAGQALSAAGMLVGGHKLSRYLTEGGAPPAEPPKPNVSPVTETHPQSLVQETVSPPTVMPPKAEAPAVAAPTSTITLADKQFTLSKPNEIVIKNLAENGFVPLKTLPNGDVLFGRADAQQPPTEPPAAPPQVTLPQEQPIPELAQPTAPQAQEPVVPNQIPPEMRGMTGNDISRMFGMSADEAYRGGLVVPEYGKGGVIKGFRVTPIGQKVFLAAQKSTVTDGLTQQTRLENIANTKPVGPDEPIISKAINPDGTIRMDISNPREMVEVFRNTYQGGIPATAGKEMLQNALDAIAHLGQNGRIIIKIDPDTRTISVEDNGMGLTREGMGTVFTDLSASGKRGGPTKTIGELGVGKTTYLTTGDNIDVRTVARDIDGKLYESTLSGSPDDILSQRVRLNTTEVPEGNATGTKLVFTVPVDENIKQFSEWLQLFEKYSHNDAPIEISEKTGSQGGIPTWSKRVVTPTTEVPSKLVHEGSTKTADFRVTLPDDAIWGERNQILYVLSARGMFQGVDAITLGKKHELPDRLVVDIDPKVKGTDKGYPLTAPTRERMKADIHEAVDKEVKRVFVEEAEKRENAQIKVVYDKMQPKGRNNHVIHDSGGRYTPEELARLTNSNTMHVIANEMQTMLQNLYALFTNDYRLTAYDPSSYTNLGHRIIDKFGFVVEPKIRGINVIDPTDRTKTAVLINPLEILKQASTPLEAANAMVHVVMHEFTHMISRSEGSGFTAALADVYTKFPLGDQYVISKVIQRKLQGSLGGYNSEIPNLLQDYENSRGRPNTETDALVRSRQSEWLGPTGEGETPSGGEPNGGGTITQRIGDTFSRFMSDDSGGFQLPFKLPFGKERQDIPYIKTPTISSERKVASPLRQVYDLSRGLTTTWDLSAPFKQGLSLIHTKAWWTSWGKMIEARRTQEAYNNIMGAIKSRSEFTRYLDPTTGKFQSYADKVGFKLTDVNEGLTGREEHTLSELAEKIPVIGEWTKKSNRAYTAYLNQLRADEWRSVLADNVKMYETAKAVDPTMPMAEIERLNPFTNMELGKELADYVMTTSGRGPLRTYRPDIAWNQKTGKFSTGWKEISAEQNAKLLTDLLFAPRLMASRVRMLNPGTYIMASPYVRRQYMKSLFATAGAWTAIAAAGSLMGNVSLDPTNSDFGKIHIGNTRIDPGGGFQQYLVAVARLMTGRETSSAQGTEFELGQGYRSPTSLDVIQNFGANKLHPAVKFAYDIAAASKYKPVYMGDRILQMFIPMVVGDVVQLMREDPSLIPIAGGASLVGMGTQTYESGKEESVYIPQEYDVPYTGGNPFNR